MNIEPFGSNDASGTINVGPQNHFGASMISFDVSADFASQGGKLNLDLVEDNDQRFRVPVIGSPYYFNLSGVDGSSIFTYGGVIDSVTRSVSVSDGKKYTVSLSSPLKVIDAVSVIVGGPYTGRGNAGEGIVGSPPLFSYGGIPFGFHNEDTPTIWELNYNVINIFGSYENEDITLGQIYPAYTHGFGSAAADGGMSLVRVCYGLDALINRLSGAKKYLGGNILYGTNSYNIAAATGTPYYYFFDALDFYSQVAPFVQPDYKVGQGNVSMSLLDLVSEICEEANMEFIVELEEGDTLSGGSGIDTFGGGPSKLGGTIKIKTLHKNSFFNPNKPFSNVAFNLIGLEQSDLATPQSGVHPGINPFGVGVYQDPLDDDFVNVGTSGHRPYGGMFPIEAQSNFDYPTGVFIENGTVGITATDGISAKFVVGGFQTRMIQVPRSNIYCYWGDITIIGGGNEITGSVDANLEQVATRKIPVVTQQLHPSDIEDYILIDMQHIYGRQNVTDVVQSGVYAASMFEVRLAMKSYEEWHYYLSNYKIRKFNGVWDFFNPRSTMTNKSSAQTAKSKSTNMLNANGGLGYAGMSAMLTLGQPFNSTITNTDKIQPKHNPSGAMTGFNGYGSYLVDDSILPKMHEIIKNIGDTHYGKSWFVPMPVPTTKFAEDQETVVGNFVRSWEISSEAYLEPSYFYSYEAPQSNEFVNDGKISAFVNYDHSFIIKSPTSPSNNFDAFNDTYQGQIVSPINGVSQSVYNFSEYDLSSLVYTKYPTRTIVHARPEDVGQQYQFLPASYHSIYNRGIIPFTDLLNRASYSYALVNVSGRIVDLAVEKGNPTSSSITPIATSTPLSKVGMRSEIVSAINNLFVLAYKDNGTNSFPYALVKTSRVYLPTLDSSVSPINSIGSNLLYGSILGTGIPLNHNFTGLVSQLSALDAYPACVCPRSISIPQVSTRFVYGPWMTNIGTQRLFSGKVIFEQDENLVPENFIIPNYGNFGTTYSNYSGFNGLDLAGQAIANSIDDFNLFADEQGSVTIPGAPRVSKIGESLYGIQNVTDLQVNVSNAQIQTTYNFRTYTPRIAKTTRDYVKRLQRIANTVKKIRNKR